MIVKVLEPFMRAQEYLEGEGYVTVSLVIPTVYRLHRWLSYPPPPLQAP